MATAEHLIAEDKSAAPREPEAVVVRFAGDSGDGMQLTGGQFTLSTALAGNDLSTFPDFPAEIRAPQGTTFGVSAFQINFGSASIDTAGDQPDVLVAMNPAAVEMVVVRHAAPAISAAVSAPPARGDTRRRVCAAPCRHCRPISHAISGPTHDSQMNASPSPRSDTPGTREAMRQKTNDQTST
jgi:hypothetical protein